MRILRRRNVVMLAAVAAALAGSPLAPAAGVAAAGSDWPQFGFSAARTSENPSETVLGPGNVAGLRQKWNFLAGEPVESSPAVVAGVVYFTSDNSHLYAVNAATGAQLWSFGFTNAFFSDPAVAGGIVYTSSVDGRLYAVNAATGAQLWSFATPGQANGRPPAVAGGVVYFQSAFGAPAGGGAVYALDAATGALLWSFATPGGTSPTGLAVDNGVVYETTSDEDGLRGSAYALSAATGQMLWHFASPGPLYTPVVADGILYAGFEDETTQARVLALHADNGKARWQSQIVGISQSPAVANGLVYVGDSYGFVDAFNATTGKLAWQFRIPPSVPTSNVDATPVVANGIVYEGAEDGTLYALGATTGQKLASFGPIGTGIISPAPVSGGAVYVGSGQYLYALALPASAP